MNGAVYLVQPQEFSESSIYKIGMTKRNDDSRISSYGMDTTVLRIVECSNPKDVETELIQLFNRKFELSKGKEYFEGNKESMIECFNNCVSTLAIIEDTPDINIEEAVNDIQSLIQNDNTITIQQILEICYPIYDSIGVNDIHRQRLKELSKLQGFTINANVELIFFGIVAEGQRSAKIRRCLARQDLLLPKSPEYDGQFYGIIEESPYCKAIRSKVKKNGQTYKKIEYFITWTGFYKVITRSVNHNKYSTYFAIQSQVMSMMTTL